MGYILSQDDNSKILQSVPKSAPLAETYDTTISSSTTVTLNADTTLLDIVAIAKPIFYKWGATASSSAFDGLIPANTSKLVPRQIGATSIQFIEQAATANLAVIEY